ncbi:hypothetical protein L596_003328 [Steinernema carpocapsae]|uniref:Uncharacterized protein n=1 Tax=Steinernema carpocapsae TaxID=34508 RepID=A0A4U8US78_STECR|nr:hypothetical protein L596_003328 [Steinernema carpocapsae]
MVRLQNSWTPLSIGRSSWRTSFQTRLPTRTRAAWRNSHQVLFPPLTSRKKRKRTADAAVESTTADAAVESTSQSPPIPSSQFKVESGEAECAQPDAKKYDNSVVDGIMVPSCSSTEPTSTVHIVHVNGDRSDALGPEEPSSSTPAEPSMPLTRLCFSGESIHIPTVLSDDEELLRSVLSKETFKSLPKESQTALKKFLPKSENDDFEDILDCVFTDDKNFCFGNALSKLVYKLKCNWFSPDRPCEELQLRDNRRVMYDHFHRHYYISTLRKLLVSRHRILEKVSELSGSEEGEIRLKTYGGFLKRKQMVDGLQERTKRRCQVMLNDVRKKVGESDLSSDDEDDGFLKARFIPNNSGKAAGKSTLFSNDFVDIDLHQPLALGSPVGMLKEYVRLKEKEPDCMSLDISDIAVDEVYDRSGVSIISERNFATLVRKRKQAVEEKCEADSSTDVRTNGRLFNNQSRGSNTPYSHSVEDDDEGRASVSCSDLDQDGHDIPDTSSVMSVNGIHSDDSDETDDEERQFEESLRRTEEANNLGSAAQSPAPS